MCPSTQIQSSSSLVGYFVSISLINIPFFIVTKFGTIVNQSYGLHTVLLHFICIVILPNMPILQISIQGFMCDWNITTHISLNTIKKNSTVDSHYVMVCGSMQFKPWTANLWYND